MALSISLALVVLRFAEDGQLSPERRWLKNSWNLRAGRHKNHVGDADDGNDQIRQHCFAGVSQSVISRTPSGCAPSAMPNEGAMHSTSLDHQDGPKKALIFFGSRCPGRSSGANKSVAIVWRVIDALPAVEIETGVEERQQPAARFGYRAGNATT